MHELAPDVYNVSVLNPGLRVFDVVMRTEYGTSYNSSVVRGQQASALIDANHGTFSQDWLARVEAALGGTTPTYLVLNHTEPDHSGATAALLERYPEITIVCTAAAALNLKHIVNCSELAVKVVKDGDSLDLGGLTLEFIGAPFLHWPDTMFTWLPQRKVAFTCDFLGSHFCEPRVYDRELVYKREFAQAVKHYYDCIMAPFAPFVLKGLDRLEALGAELVVPSHGPVLTQGGCLEQVSSLYREWAAAATAPHKNKQVSVVYCSAYRNTAQLAEALAQGICAALPSAEVRVSDLVDADLAALGAELNASDAFCLGSPTINRDAVPVVWQLLAELDAVNIAKRPVALFGSYGWSGEALPHLAARLGSLKVALFEEPFRVQFTPTAEDLAAIEAYGRAFAESFS